jgi:cold shock CspA family protein
MQIPLDITARNATLMQKDEALIRRKAAALDKFYDRLTGCRVVVEGPGGHHQTGGPYRVRVNLMVPTGEISVDRQVNEELTAAIHAAFDAARRRLQDHARLLDDRVKTRVSPPVGRVSKIFPELGYGFIETPGGVELYFHRNSVVDSTFEELGVGTEVRFAEEQGEKGPQASTVHVVGAHTGRS